MSSFLEKKPNANEQNYISIWELPLLVSHPRRSSCAVNIEWKATACEGAGLWACTAVTVTLLLCRSAWIWQHETVCPTTLCSSVYVSVCVYVCVNVKQSHVERQPLFNNETFIEWNMRVHLQQRTAVTAPNKSAQFLFMTRKYDLHIIHGYYNLF